MNPLFESFRQAPKAFVLARKGQAVPMSGNGAPSPFAALVASMAPDAGLRESSESDETNAPPVGGLSGLIQRGHSRAVPRTSDTGRRLTPETETEVQPREVTVVDLAPLSRPLGNTWDPRRNHRMPPRKQLTVRLGNVDVRNLDRLRSMQATTYQALLEEAVHRLLGEDD